MNFKHGVLSYCSRVLLILFCGTEIDGENCGSHSQIGDNDRMMNTALAVVPYEPDQLLPHHKHEREFTFAGHRIQIQQNWNGLGVAAVVWDAAVVMCEYLEQHADLVRSKKVIELGAGTGLAGMVASFLGGDVTVTERLEALPNLQETVNVNTADKVSVRELDWTKQPAADLHGYDVILGADIVYIEETFPDLLRTLASLVQSDTLVLLACRIRYNRDIKFLALLKKSFTVEEVFYDKSRDIKMFSAKVNKH